MYLFKFLLLLLLFSFIISCNVCEWNSSLPYPHQKDEIWRTVYDVVSKRYDIIRASQEKYELETDWRKQMSIQYLESFRSKVHIKIEDYIPPQEVEKDLSKPLDLEAEKKGKIKQNIIKICVLREQNRNLDNPNIASQADWYTTGNDFDEMSLLLNFFTARLAMKMPSKEKEIEESTQP